MLEPRPALDRLRAYQQRLDLAGHVLKLKCYHRAMLIAREAARLGLSTSVQMGVRREGEELEGHAWLSDDLGLADRPETRPGDHQPMIEARPVDRRPEPLAPHQALAVAFVRAYHAPGDTALLDALHAKLTKHSDVADSVLDLARHRALLIACAVMRREPSLQALEAWSDAIEAASAPHLNAESQAERAAESIHEAFERAGLDSRAVKGGAIMREWPEYGRLRMAPEVEFLVPAGQLPEARRLCRELDLELREAEASGGHVPVHVHRHLHATEALDYEAYSREVEARGEAFMRLAGTIAHHACARRYVRDPLSLSDMLFGLEDGQLELSEVAQWAWESRRGGPLRTALAWMLPYLPVDAEGAEWRWKLPVRTWMPGQADRPR